MFGFLIFITMYVFILIFHILKDRHYNNHYSSTYLWKGKWLHSRVEDKNDKEYYKSLFILRAFGLFVLSFMLGVVLFLTLGKI